MIINTLPDGKYYEEQLNALFSVIGQKQRPDNGFLNEADFCDYLEANMAKFVYDVLGEKLSKCQREYGILKQNRAGNLRLDFLIETESANKIGVECKHPSYKSEMSSAVGQCLKYIVEFERIGKPINKMFLVSTKMDAAIPQIIKRFNLPILFIVMDKSKSITLCQ